MPNRQPVHHSAVQAHAGSADSSAKPPRTVESGRYVVVSTAHITRADNALLEELSTGAYRLPLTLIATGCGYAVSLLGGAGRPALDEARAWLQAQGLSEAFVRLWSGMRARGFVMLQLDADAAPVEGYHTFDW